jgi:hypothetical protein
MVRHITNQDPSGVVVERESPSGQVNSSTATAGQHGQTQGWKVWVGSASLTSVAAANLSFQNPESGAVLARVSYAITGSAGTGTTDVGVGTAGTGDSDEYFNGGLLTAGVHSRFTFNGTVAASAILGTVDLGQQVIAANGEGGDSVVFKVTDTATSTMGAYYGIVEYIDIVTG